jgi:transcriptional regulator with XRE-family HTH domain
MAIAVANQSKRKRSVVGEQKQLSETAQWVRDVCKHTGMTPTGLAKAADVAPSTVLRLHKGEDHRFNPSLRTLRNIATAAQYPIPRSVIDRFGMTEDAPAPTPKSVREALETLSPTARLGRHLSIPVRFVSSLVPRSLHPAAPRPMTTRCPPQLENDDNAFAFQCPDNSLDPWVKVGSMLYATTGREPQIGDLVMITDRNGMSKVRMLSDMDETGMILSRPSPFGADESVAYGDYESIAVVVVTSR